MSFIYNRPITPFWRKAANASIGLLLALLPSAGHAQTVLLSPTVNNGGFESGTTGWSFAQTSTGTNDHNWAVGSAPTAFAGTNAAYIASAGAAGSWTYSTSTSRTSHMYRDVTFPAGETTITFNFQWKSYGESGWDRLLVYIAPTSVTPVAGSPSSNSTSLTGATLLWTQPTFNSTSGSTYSQASVSISAAQAGNTSANSTMRLIFTWQNDGSGGSAPPACVDNINLTSSCSGAVATTASNIASSSATLNWNAFTGATGYQVRYKKISDATSVTTWATPTSVTGNSTTSLAVTGLTSLTDYEYQVAAVGATCGAFSPSSTFTTATGLPFYETFTTATMPVGWSATEGSSGASYHWSPTTADASHGASAPATGTYFAYLYVFLAQTGYNPYYLNTPSITLPCRTNLSYNYFLGTGGYTGTSPYPLIVQISTNGGGTWTDLYSHHSGNSTIATSSTSAWTANTIDLASYAGQTVKLRFLSNSNYGGGTCDQGLDDILIEVKKPTGTNSLQCSAGTPTCSVTSTSGVTTPVFRWYTVATGGTPIAGQSGSTLSSYSISSNTTFYVSEIVGTAESQRVAVTATVNPPPTFNQPSNATTCENSSASFAVNVTSTGTYTYQWQVNTGSGFNNVTNNSTYSGAGTATLNITGATAAMNGYIYRCAIGGGACPGTTNTNSVTLTVNRLPSIASQTNNLSVCENSNAVFSVNANGAGLTYQWQVNTGSGFNNITNGLSYSGATSSQLTVISPTPAANGYQYRCIVSGTCAPSVNSTNSTLTVNTITKIVTDVLYDTTCEGIDTQIPLNIAGSGLNYQWQVDNGGGFVNLANTGIYSGTTTNTLKLKAPTTAVDGYTYRCIATGVCGTPQTSLGTRMTVWSFPTITNQPPASDSVNAGENVTFTVAATGSHVRYQWQVNEDTIVGFRDLYDNFVYTGTKTNSLHISNTYQSKNGNQYRCIVGGECEADTSVVINLKVGPPLGINNLAKNNASVSVYPNPVSGNMLTLKIESSVTKDLHIKIVDQFGRIIRSEPVELSNMNTKDIDVSNLVPGVYILQVNNDASELNQSIRFTRE